MSTENKISFLVKISMVSVTSHHLIISNVCYCINMRAIFNFLAICCDKVIPINWDIFEGIDCNQKRPCFTLQKGKKATTSKWSVEKETSFHWQAQIRRLSCTYINDIMRISVLKIVYNWWLIQITKLYEIIHTHKDIWVCR